VEDGRIGLDDPVSRYIPAFAEMKVFAGGTAAAPDPGGPRLAHHGPPAAQPHVRARVRPHARARGHALRRGQLYHAGRSLEEFTDLLARIPLLFHPGTQWSYGSGLDVAGRVIEVVSGQTLDGS
jgi:CubicO group peptidase (beta-lactamase class C family)